MKTLKSTLGYEGKTLELQLLQKPSLEIFEIQDLSSTNGTPKLLFYGYSWHIFFLQPITEGNCDILIKSIQLFRITLLVCILGEVNISYIFCFIFRDLLTFRKNQVNVFLEKILKFESLF